MIFISVATLQNLQNHQKEEREREREGEGEEFLLIKMSRFVP